MAVGPTRVPTALTSRSIGAGKFGLEIKVDYKTLDTFKVAPENEGAFNRIKEAADAREYVKLALVGASGAGKTHLLHGTTVASEPLMGKKITFISAGELAITARAIENDTVTQISESFLEKIGACDFLIVDDFDTNIFDGTTAAKLFSLLVGERDRQKKPTIVAARVWDAQRADEELAACLSDFEVVLMDALVGDEVEKAEVAKLLIDLYEADARPQITDEAVAYIVGTHAKTISDVPNMMRFLLEGNAVSAGELVDVAKAKSLFE